MTTAIPQTAEALFAQSGMGAPIFFNKDSVIGQSISGTVLEAIPSQARDFDSGDPKFWDDGSPMLQLSITLSTTLRDPSIENDKGERRHFVKWWGANQKALVLVVSRAGDKAVRVGATMTITFSGVGEPKGRLSGEKLYTFTYTPPPTPAAAATEALFAANGTNVSTTAPAIVTTPPAVVTAAPTIVTAPPPAPTNTVDSLAKVKKLADAGFDIAAIHELVPALSLDMIQAIVNI